MTGNGLLVSDGRTWQHHRRIAAPLFQPRAADVLTRQIAHEAARGVDELAQRPGTQAVDLASVFRRWAVAISGRAMFSLEMSAFGVDLQRLAEEYVDRFARPYLSDVLLPLRVRSPRDLARARSGGAGSPSWTR